MKKSLDDSAEYYKSFDIPKKRLKQIWKYDNDYDFWYGHIVGGFTAIVMQLFYSEYDRQPQEDELDEIAEIIEENAKSLRQNLSFLK